MGIKWVGQHDLLLLQRIMIKGISSYEAMYA